MQVSPSFAARHTPARSPGVAGDRQVPRVPLPRRGVTSSGVMCATTSSGVTPSSSLIRTHASDHPPLPGFSFSPYTGSPDRLPSAPAGEWPFPTLSLRNPSWMTAPVPRRFPWCMCPFLPMRHRPSSRAKHESASHHNPHGNFGADAISQFLRAPEHDEHRFRPNLNAESGRC